MSLQKRGSYFPGLNMVGLILAFLVGLSSCSNSHVKKNEELAPVDYENVVLLGGDATSADLEPTSHGFRVPIPSLTEDEMEWHLDGDKAFESSFSYDPQYPQYGLGPVFNNHNCISCHNRDGRGSLPVGLRFDRWQKLGQNEAIFLRVSIESDDILQRVPDRENQYKAPVSVPGFSSQLFHLGSSWLRDDVPGVGQAEVWVKLERSFFRYPDGKEVELVKPIFKIEKPYDVDVNEKGERVSRIWMDDVRTSPRMGMPMFGLGLLEAVPENTIIDLAKKDFSIEGVFGKINYVFDIEKFVEGIDPARSIGRFGLKANTPSVLHQSLGALNGDMGVTNQYFQHESIEGTKLMDIYCRKQRSLCSDKNRREVEASDQLSRELVFYSRTLAVPPRRNLESKHVIYGARLFNLVNCTSCHTPSLKTGDSDVAALANQAIYPFTDMLIHDMGDGLADGRQDFLATGRQWRTRPLWGIGLTQLVNPRAGFLHDGRARTLEEAILWHDGEARHSRDKFVQLNSQQRLDLVAFLRSL